MYLFTFAHLKGAKKIFERVDSPCPWIRYMYACCASYKFSSVSIAHSMRRMLKKNNIFTCIYNIWCLCIFLTLFCVNSFKTIDVTAHWINIPKKKTNWSLVNELFGQCRPRPGFLRWQGYNELRKTSFDAGMHFGNFRIYSVKIGN